jgi:small-conductance mechanosensitive channel
MISVFVRMVRDWARTTVATTALFVPLIAAAAAPPSLQPVAAESPDTAPVKVDGEVLFRVRGVSSFPAKQRAREISERIQAVARDESFPASDLRLVDEAGRIRIVARSRNIMGIFDVDAQAEQVDSRQTLAEAHVRSIATAIERYRRERTSAYLERQGIHGAVVIGLLAALLVAMRYLFRCTRQVVQRRVDARLKALEARSFRLLSAEELKAAWQGGLRAVEIFIGFVLVFSCVTYVLSLFPWTRPFAQGCVALLVDPLKTMWAGLVDALPGLVFIVILIIVIRYILKVTSLFFGGIAAGRIRPAGFDRDWAWPTYRLVRFGVLAFAVVVAYPYIPGSSTDAFKGVSIFLGLLMSLGAASMVANSLAGFVLIYRRAFKVGDRIKVGDVVGDVVAIRQQVTQVRTPKNEEVTIPSSTILGSSVVNYSALARDDGLILHTTVGIGYETPWRQVEAMLIEAANRTEGLKRDPAPFVLQTALGDFCVTYEINVYCDRPEEMARLYTGLHQNILDVFNEHGVQIMTPAYEADPGQPKLVPKDQWYAHPAKPPPAK